MHVDVNFLKKDDHRTTMAAETAPADNPPSDGTESVDKATLAALSNKALRELAKALKASVEQLDECSDSNEPREALLALVHGLDVKAPKAAKAENAQLQLREAQRAAPNAEDAEGNRKYADMKARERWWKNVCLAVAAVAAAIAVALPIMLSPAGASSPISAYLWPLRRYHVFVLGAATSPNVARSFCAAAALAESNVGAEHVFLFVPGRAPHECVGIGMRYSSDLATILAVLRGEVPVDGKHGLSLAQGPYSIVLTVCAHTGTHNTEDDEQMRTAAARNKWVLAGLGEKARGGGVVLQRSGQVAPSTMMRWDELMDLVRFWHKNRCARDHRLADQQYTHRCGALKNAILLP
eukprot:SAG11_NODE_1198_length_5543_cov_25.218038_3_plen_352_part_00